MEVNVEELDTLLELGTRFLAGLPDIYKQMIMALECYSTTISDYCFKVKLHQDIRQSEPMALFSARTGDQFLIYPSSNKKRILDQMSNQILTFTIKIVLNLQRNKLNLSYGINDWHT